MLLRSSSISQNIFLFTNSHYICVHNINSTDLRRGISSIFVNLHSKLFDMRAPVDAGRGIYDTTGVKKPFGPVPPPPQLPQSPHGPSAPRTPRSSQDGGK
jgi:hypothetical protein